MTKPKIAILSPFAGVITRGAETFVTEFTKALRDRYDITVFSYGIEKELEAETVQIPKLNIPFLQKYKAFYKRLDACAVSPENNVCAKLLRFVSKKVIRLLYITTFLLPTIIEQRYFTQYVFKNHIRGSDYDLIFPNNGIWGVKYASRLRKISGTPFIYTGHGGIGDEEKRILLEKPNMYIATNVVTLDWAKQIYGRVVYIPLGTDLRRFERDIKVDPQFENLEHPIVLCVAAFSAFKRHKLLIDAFAKLQKGTLLLIGDNGELKQVVQDYCEKKIPGRYIMTQVPYHENFAYFKLCDVFSLPSIGEAFGIVYVEAMAANKPVVTTNDKAREVIVGPAGILCNVENSDEYAKALQDALQKDWNDIPLHHVKENFTWEIIANKYDDIIKSLIK